MEIVSYGLIGIGGGIYGTNEGFFQFVGGIMIIWGIEMLIKAIAKKTFQEERDKLK